MKLWQYNCYYSLLSSQYFFNYIYFSKQSTLISIFINISSKIKFRLSFNGFNIFRNKNFVCITITCYIYKFVLIVLEFTNY